MPSIEIGGVEKNLFIISNYLSQKIKGIKILTTNKEDKKYFKNIKLICPNSEFWKKRDRKLKYLACLLVLIKIFLKKRDFVVFSFQANLYCTIICKLFGVKIIVRSNASPQGYYKNNIKLFLYKYFFSFADQIIVNSYDFKKQFKKFFLLNAKCIYNPLNKKYILKESKAKLNFPFFKKKNKILKLISVGRFTDQKDHLTLLRAVNLIKNKVDFKLALIGKGQNENLIKNFINQNNLNNKVKIINFQKNPFKFINYSDVFILTSKYEGLPNVLLEAAVLKKFIISTNCPTGPKEILKGGKGGDLVDVGDFKSISKKIENFNKNKSKLKSKINFNYRSLNRFDYRNNLKKYLNVVKKYLN